MGIQIYAKNISNLNKSLFKFLQKEQCSFKGIALILDWRSKGSQSYFGGFGLKDLILISYF